MATVEAWGTKRRGGPQTPASLAERDGFDLDQGGSATPAVPAGLPASQLGLGNYNPGS